MLDKKNEGNFIGKQEKKEEKFIIENDKFYLKKKES